jgi:hypothetical protein
MNLAQIWKNVSVFGVGDWPGSSVKVVIFAIGQRSCWRGYTKQKAALPEPRFQSGPRCCDRS